MLKSRIPGSLDELGAGWKHPIFGHSDLVTKHSCIHEKLFLRMFAGNNSTDTNTIQKSKQQKTFQMSCVTFHVSPVTNANSHRARDPPTANSPTTHNRLFCQDIHFVLGYRPIYKPSNLNVFCCCWNFALHSLTRKLQSTGFKGMCDGTNTHTHRQTLGPIDQIGLGPD